uniref:RING-type E3 ubiquitin transferase n=1 Tax=Aceria tosichella TaxID=561515 RepID=A0A6G1SEH9_9ACAR
MSQIIAESSSSSQNLAAQPILVDTEKYYCPFLERGFCRDSSRCNFSHDCYTSIKIPTDYCHFYLANQCLFGQDCKFLHSEPDDDNTLLNNIVDTNSSQADGSLFACGSGGLDGDGFPNNYDIPSEQDQANHYEVGGSSNQEDKGDDEQYSNNQEQQLVSRLRAIRISRRCAMTTPSTSTTIIAKLKLPANIAAQNPSEHPNCSTSDNKTTTTTTAANKSSWQGARLIASIRNNLGINDQAGSSSGNGNSSSSNNDDEHGLKDLPLCPYSQASGECPFPEGHCNYLHGLVCDLCYSACLHPYNEEQRHQHREECLREHEREMELSFAVQRSKDKVCGICMDTVVEKKPVTSSRFGILEKCNHIFCLDCIRKWRGTKQFDSRTIRACPECRVSSDFVIPSKYWVEDQADKDRLINEYKEALKLKPCRYFDEGKGDCPFAGSCFYKHAYPDGRIALMETPKPRRRLYGARGTTSSVANYILWNILTSTDEDDLSDNEIRSLSDDSDLDDLDDFIDSDLENYWLGQDGIEM